MTSPISASLTTFPISHWFGCLCCSHHVSVFDVGAVLQQLLHHLQMTFFSCRDQRRPAVLTTHTGRWCYRGNSSIGITKQPTGKLPLFPSNYSIQGEDAPVTESFYYYSTNYVKETETEGVFVLLTTSSRLTLAPLLMSSWTISRLPCSAASIRGV